MAHSAGSAPDAFCVCSSQIMNWYNIYFYLPWFLWSLCLASPLIAIRVCWLAGNVVSMQVWVAGKGPGKPLQSLGKEIAALFLSHTLLPCTLAGTVWQVSMEIMEIGPAVAAYQVWFLAICRCFCLKWENSKDWPFLLSHSVLLFGITLTFWAPEGNMWMCEGTFCLREWNRPIWWLCEGLGHGWGTAQQVEGWLHPALSTEQAVPNASSLPW